VHGKLKKVLLVLLLQLLHQLLRLTLHQVQAKEVICHSKTPNP
jgi:hypothetical protein